MHILNVDVPDAEDERWEQRAQDLQFNALPNLQAKAAKWGNVITALAGIFGVVLIARGPDEFSTLVSDWQWAVTSAIIAAFVALFVAIYFAAMAAQSWDVRVCPSGPEVKKKYEDETPLAQRDLLVSRWATVLAVALVIGSIVFTWVGQAPKAQPSQYVLVHETSGLVLCGALTTDPTTGQVALNTSASRAPIPIHDVVSITAVSTCR